MMFLDTALLKAAALGTEACGGAAGTARDTVGMVTRAQTAIQTAGADGGKAFNYLLSHI
jgi:hypothetical protein